MPTIIHHGAHAVESCFEVVQHRYAGTSEDYSCYIELLEIKDPPPGKKSVLIYRWEEGHGGMIIDFRSVDEAIDGFSAFLRERGQIISRYALEPKGASAFFLMPIGLTPWFYATDRKQIKGHFAIFPPSVTTP
jgi:hypothetical protein